MKYLIAFILISATFCNYSSIAQSSKNSTSRNTQSDTDDIYDSPTVKASIDLDYIDFIKKNMPNQDHLDYEAIKGNVIIQGVIEKDGSISNLNIWQQKLGYGLDEAVMATIKKLPKFKPAKHNGKIVRSTIVFIVPLEYNNAALYNTVYPGPDPGPNQEMPKDDMQIYMIVEQKAEQPEGWQKFLSDNLKYPKEALDNGIGGRVIVQIVVEKDGSIANVTTTNTPWGYGLEKEAIRVVQLLPKFKPARQNGAPVRSYFKLPVMFVLH